MRINNKEKPRGFVLIVVLWVLFFLSVSALTLSYKKKISVRAGSFRNEKMRMFYLAQEGVTRVLSFLWPDETEFDCLRDNWNKGLVLEKDNARLECRIVDEDRFLNINTAPLELLAGLSKYVPDITEENVQAIIKARPFNVKAELRLFVEMSDDIFYGDDQRGRKGINDLITVFSDGKVNVNTVDREVLLLFPQLTEIAVQAIIDRRRDMPFDSNATLSEDLSQIGLSPGQISAVLKLLKVDSSVYRIEANAFSPHKHIAHDLEMILKRGKDKLKVLYAKES